MSKTEIVLLRKEVKKLISQNDDLRKENAKIKDERLRDMMLLQLELDRLQQEILKYSNRLRKYENPNAPSSTDPLYNHDRDTFRRKLDADKPKPEVDNSRKENQPANNNKIGAPKGHQGSSHGNKADRTVRTPVCRCEKCGRGHLKAGAWVMMVYDFPQDGTMKIEKVAHFMGSGYCKRCNYTSHAKPPTLPNTSFGPIALGFILEYYHNNNTDNTISYYFESLYGFKTSANSIWNARKAIRNLLRGTYDKILGHIAEAQFVQFNESPIKISGKRGYTWLVTIPNATFLVVAPSRSAVILDLYFGKLLDKPAVVDGYCVYYRLAIKQRCWVHILHDAEEYTMKNDKGLVQYRRLLALYNSIKKKESADSAKCLDLQRTLHNIAQSYPEKHKFRITLENAAPFLFTFLRYPRMPPHNNDAEREIRDTVVLQNNVRHHLVNAKGMEVFQYWCLWRVPAANRAYFHIRQSRT